MSKENLKLSDISLIFQDNFFNKTCDSISNQIRSKVNTTYLTEEDEDNEYTLYEHIFYNLTSNNYKFYEMNCSINQDVKQIIKNEKINTNMIKNFIKELI